MHKQPFLYLSKNIEAFQAKRLGVFIKMSRWFASNKRTILSLYDYANSFFSQYFHIILIFPATLLQERIKSLPLHYRNSHFGNGRFLS